jgi:hypothetical protein
MTDLAGWACAAPDNRVDSNLIACAIVPHLISHFDNLAGEFMSLYQGQFRARMEIALEDMLVGATYAGIRGFHKHLVRGNSRCGDIVPFDGTVFFQYCSFHGLQSGMGLEGTLI